MLPGGGCPSFCRGLDDPDHFLWTVTWANLGTVRFPTDLSRSGLFLVDWLNYGDIKLSLLCMDSALSRERVSTTKQLTRLAGGGDPACTLFCLYYPFLAREPYLTFLHLHHARTMAAQVEEEPDLSHIHWSALEIKNVCTSS